MSEPTEPTKLAFGKVFHDRIDRIVGDAKAAGVNLTVVCKDAGISRATPDRWRRKLPKTIAIIERMEQVVAERSAAAQAAAPTEASQEDEA